MTGLTTREAKQLQAKYGKNELAPQKKETLFHHLLHALSEPMFLLLIIAAVIYFILGEPRDGAIMLIFVVSIISIDVVQEWKTDRTLDALKDLSTPRVVVMRDGREIEIASADLVPGDLMIIQEGMKIPADGIIMNSNDLRVDESSLTGEAEGIWKSPADEGRDLQPAEESAKSRWRTDYCYAGTLVIHGSATVLVDKIGASTEYGKIGSHVAAAPEKKTPLQRQIRVLVKWSAYLAVILCILVSVITFFNTAGHELGDRIIKSILSGITLAMAMIPEEFPVILAVFLSMGAWRLAKKHSLIRKLPSVETLGAISVLCVDKTGTITKNQMTVEDAWPAVKDQAILTETMGLACETDAYDPMELAMLEYCSHHGFPKKQLFSGELIDEYAFTNELKMMGHVWQRDGQIILAAKGSPERLLKLCKLTDDELKTAKAQVKAMSEQGLRVIAVGRTTIRSQEGVEDDLTDYRLTFCGLVGLADPPRETVKRDIAICRQAGIRVVMITGDNGITAASIAERVGMNHEHIITGDMIDKMTDQELRKQVKTVNIFSRVIPEHKMRIVKALKSNGEVVAMTGDGVNDAPALKYADIGIAMGKRGSEVSREAADLILMDDNFSTIVHTIEDGRRIHDNIRKAVGYVFAIHIPIALASLLAPMLGIDPAYLLILPVHVVLLELVVDPTCSIVLERQPAEDNIMKRPPRNPKAALFNFDAAVKSVMQGLVIFGASFATYYAMLPHGVETARAMGISIIILSSLFLVLVNSSDHEFAFKSLHALAKDKVMWATILITFAGLAAVLYTPLNGLLRLTSLSVVQLITTIFVAFAAVFWYELVKLVQRLAAR